MIIKVIDGGWGPIESVRSYLPENADFSGMTCLTEEDIIKAAADADAIMAEYAPLTRKTLSHLKRCRIISNSTVGIDNIDVAAATDFGIAIANVPGYCTYEVADHTLALLLALNRNIVNYEKKVRCGIWDIDSAPPMRRLDGQVMGLIGFGQIARMVADRAASFGLRVIAYDPFVEEKTAGLHHTVLTSLEDLFAQSDIISLHLPLSDQSAGFLNREKFEMMKKKPVLINTARGKIIAEQDLIHALKEGLVSAAALDVMVSEPPDFSSELFSLPNVIITPHAGFYSETSVEELRRRCALNITNFFKGNYDAISILNPEVLKK